MGSNLRTQPDYRLAAYQALSQLLWRFGRNPQTCSLHLQPTVHWGTLRPQISRLRARVAGTSLIGHTNTFNQTMGDLGLTSAHVSMDSVHLVPRVPSRSATPSKCFQLSEESTNMSFKAFELAPVIEKVVASSNDRPKTVGFCGVLARFLVLFCTSS